MTVRMKAFKCDLCSTYQDGIEEKIPETWLCPSVHIEVLGVGMNITPELRIESIEQDVCTACNNLIVQTFLREWVERIGLYPEALTT